MRFELRVNKTQNRWPIGFIWIMIVLLLFVPCIGCANKEEKQGKHPERARQYIEKKEFKKAVIELRNVIQLDTENDAAHYKLGETYLMLKQGGVAYQAFSRKPG